MKVLEPLSELKETIQRQLREAKEGMLGLVPQLKLHIKEMFEARPLYVMLEDTLGCDPRTDHEAPKDVFPIY